MRRCVVCKISAFFSFLFSLLICITACVEMQPEGRLSRPLPAGYFTNLDEETVNRIYKKDERTAEITTRASN